MPYGSLLQIKLKFLYIFNYLKLFFHDWDKGRQGKKEVGNEYFKNHMKADMSIAIYFILFFK